MATNPQSIKHISKINILPTGLDIKPNYIYLQKTSDGFKMFVSSSQGGSMRELDVGLRIFNSKNERIYWGEKMTDIYVIQPNEMGSDFVFDVPSGKWKISQTGQTVSADFNNLLTNGTDGRPFLNADQLKKYYLIQNNTEKKIKLYSYESDYFDILTATLVSEVDMSTLEAQFDDIDISGTVLTFKDDLGNTLTFDTNSPIYAILKANTNAIQLAGDGKTSTLTATLIVDPSTNNLLKITVNGAMVDKNDILAVVNQATTNNLTSSGNTMTSTVNGKTSSASIVNSNLTTVDTTNLEFKTSVNGVESQKHGLNTLKSTGGSTLGYIFNGTIV